jgi:hypothetical protein
VLQVEYYLEFHGAVAGVYEVHIADLNGWLGVVSTMSTDGDAIPSSWVGVLRSVMTSWLGSYYMYLNSNTAQFTGVSFYLCLQLVFLTT